MQDRFGKAPEEFRRTSDENEGLCFNWAPAAIPLPDSPASGGAVAIAGPYMPLQGSLQPDADLDSFPEQHSLATMVGIFPKPPVLLSVAWLVWPCGAAGPDMCQSLTHVLTANLLSCMAYACPSWEACCPMLIWSHSHSSTAWLYVGLSLNATHA